MDNYTPSYLESLPPEEAKAILHSLPPEEAKRLRLAINHKAYSAIRALEMVDNLNRNALKSYMPIDEND